MWIVGRCNFSFAFPVIDCMGGEALNGLVASVAMAAGFRMLGILPKMSFRLTSDSGGGGTRWVWPHKNNTSLHLNFGRLSMFSKVIMGQGNCGIGFKIYNKNPYINIFHCLQTLCGYLWNYCLFYVKRDNLKLQYVTFLGLKLHFKKEFAALGQISQKIDIVGLTSLIVGVCMLRIHKQYLYKCVAFVL